MNQTHPLHQIRLLLTDVRLLLAAAFLALLTFALHLSIQTAANKVITALTNSPTASLQLQQPRAIAPQPPPPPNPQHFQQWDEPTGNP